MKSIAERKPGRLPGAGFRKAASIQLPAKLLDDLPQASGVPLDDPQYLFLAARRFGLRLRRFLTPGFVGRVHDPIVRDETKGAIEIGQKKSRPAGRAGRLFNPRSSPKVGWVTGITLAAES